MGKFALVKITYIFIVVEDFWKGILGAIKREYFSGVELISSGVWSPFFLSTNRAEYTMVVKGCLTSVSCQVEL